METTCRDNFERLDALTYDIQVEGRLVEPEQIQVTRHYRLQWRSQRQDLQKREGPIVLGLVPMKGSFQVKRLVYR